MPPVHSRIFRVRHYECDAYGHLNHANYLRYMQETAFDVSAAVGYDMARYEELGTLWLIHETDIEYLRPLVYGDSVEVRTWVLDCQRVRSRRVYEFYHTVTGELTAKAVTDWAYLDRQTRRPCPIPPELSAALLGDAPPDGVPPRQRFPSAPPPPPGVFRVRRRVEWRDVDPMGHVNNATYLSYAEDCGIQVARSYGWPVKRMTAEGFGIVARRHQIEYRAPAMFDDEIEVATWIAAIRNTSVIRCYLITRPSDGALLARVQSLWVWVDIQTGKPIRVHPSFRTDFAPNIAAG
jgi:acyl-CoA thioester hydrolase